MQARVQHNSVRTIAAVVVLADMLLTMRRSFAIVLYVLTFAFIAIGLTIGTFWPIGYRHVYMPSALHVGIAVTHGSVSAIFNVDDLPAWPPSILSFQLETNYVPAPVPHEWMGFGAGVTPNGEGQARMPVAAAILASFAIAAASWSAARRLPEKSPTSRCRTCGYDLRASPDRCPECGTVTAA